MKPLFKLQGHNASVLCCATSSTSPDLVLTSSEDGRACVFDLRTKICVAALQVSQEEAVASISLKPGGDNQLYAAAGKVIHCLDLRLGSSGREMQKYEFNTDEINQFQQESYPWTKCLLSWISHQVVVNQKGTYLAAADDSGEIKVIDLSNDKLYKTLRGGHTNICSSVQFHPQKPWEAMSGGLDSKIVRWDFSKGRQMRTIDPVVSTVDSGGQMCNPPFVHALATPLEECSGEMGRAVAVARGDGAVEVYDSGFEDRRPTRVKGSKNGGSKSNTGEEEGAELFLKSGLRCRLTADSGGHLTAVSSVTFARFGGTGRYLLSGGNDGLVKLWDWANPNCKDRLGGNDVPLSLNIRHRKKINWLSTTKNSSANLVVADTSEALSLYHVL